MKFIIYVFFIWSGVLFCYGNEILCYSSLCPPNIFRADLYYLDPNQYDSKPEIVLILCPGVNGNGRYLVAQKIWQDFVKKHKIGLVGISFASPVDSLHEKRGYYYPELGSGKILVAGINKIFGCNTRILIYGFSGGAHFAARFTEWLPTRVIAWCSYSAMWWDSPSKSKLSPPGLIICGADDPRLGASLSYFKEGRSTGKRWSWLEIPNSGHSPNIDAEDFVRNFFSKIITMEDCPLLSEGSIWVDIETGKLVPEKIANRIPTITAWLPDCSLLEDWRNIAIIH